MEKNNLQQKSKENQPPNDLVDKDNPIGDKSIPEKILTLFDYFNRKEGDSSIIKNWSSNFRSHSLLSFCDILSTILQLSGKRIEITVEHIESDAFDIVLDEFLEDTEFIKTRKTFKNPKITKNDINKKDDSDSESEDQDDDENEEKNESDDSEDDNQSDEGKSSQSIQVPPITSFLKDKVLSKTLTNFWHDLSEAMVSCNALYDNHFINFRQWLIAFNKSKIRIIRQTSSFCALSLFNTLAVSINRSRNELSKLTNLLNENDENKKNPMLTQSKTLYEQDVKLYTSVSLYILQNVIYLRINLDDDDNIRMMAVKSLTDAAIDCPSEFTDYQKLKCLEKILKDKSSRNRRDVLRCIQRILGESPLSKSSIKIDSDMTNNLFFYEKIKPLAIKFVPIILGLLNDRENSVVASAIDTLYSFADYNLLVQNKEIEELCINSVSSLLSDESQVIRSAAAKFFAKLLFEKCNTETDNNTSINKLVEFLQKYFCSNKSKDENANNEDDLQIVIFSLFPNLPFLHDWDEMIDILSIEEDNNKARILAKVLLYSAEKLNSSNNYVTSSSSSSSVDYINQIRKLSLSLVKSLPRLIKGYQNNDDIVLPLVDAARFINLDIVSENSYEHYFQKLLAEICNIFLHNSNRSVFTTSIASLYELSGREHQLSLIARHELDRLAVECGNDCDLTEFYSEKDQSSISSLQKVVKDVVDDRESIAKFVAAARLVDVSDNGKLRRIVINRIKILSKIFEKNDEDLNFDSDFKNLILEVISDCIECLQFIFRWDIKHIHNKKLSKEDYKETFLENLDIFYRFLTTTMIVQSDQNDTKNEGEEEENSENYKEIKSNAANLVKENSFKALGDVISLSPFLKQNFDDVLIKPEIVEDFYSSYHKLFSKYKKAELFSDAMHPIQTRAIELSYATHLLIYFGFNPLQQSVKILWKNLSQGRKVIIRGTHLLNSLILGSFSLDKAELKLSMRFMLGKIKCIDFIDQFLRFESQSDSNINDMDQYEAIVTASLPFFFGITKEMAKDIISNDEIVVPSKYNEILSLIANDEKPTQKCLTKIIQASKPVQNQSQNQSQNRSLPASNKSKPNNDSNKKIKNVKKKIESELENSSSSSTTTTDSDSDTSSS